MWPVLSRSPHVSRAADTPIAGRAKAAAQPCRFVLSRCLGSSSYYSLWLLQGNCLLQHWIVLADGLGGLRQPTLFLIQSADRLLPAAHYDEGSWEFSPAQLTDQQDPEHQTARQALAKGCLTLRLDGQHLQGSYLLQRVGTGRGHTWQLMLISKLAAQKSAC